MTQPTDLSKIDYSKPHAFELEVGRLTRVCKCGAPQGVAIHSPAVAEAVRRFEVHPYGKQLNQCLQKATDDMPLFVLKPSDEIAVQVIEYYWYMLNLNLGGGRPKLDDAMQVRNAFKRWQAANPKRVKVAD